MNHALRVIASSRHAGLQAVEGFGGHLELRGRGRQLARGRARLHVAGRALHGERVVGVGFGLGNLVRGAVDGLYGEVQGRLPALETAEPLQDVAPRVGDEVHEGVSRALACGPLSLERLHVAVEGFELGLEAPPDVLKSIAAVTHVALGLLRVGEGRVAAFHVLAERRYQLLQRLRDARLTLLRGDVGSPPRESAGAGHELGGPGALVRVVDGALRFLPPLVHVSRRILLPRLLRSPGRLPARRRPRERCVVERATALWGEEAVSLELVAETAPAHVPRSLGIFEEGHERFKLRRSWVDAHPFLVQRSAQPAQHLMGRDASAPELVKVREEVAQGNTPLSHHARQAHIECGPRAPRHAVPSLHNGARGSAAKEPPCAQFSKISRRCVCGQGFIRAAIG